MKDEEENISIQIENIHSYFSDYANRQVNYAYTLRNWLIGMYICLKLNKKGKAEQNMVKNYIKKLQKD